MPDKRSDSRSGTAQTVGAVAAVAASIDLSSFSGDYAALVVAEFVGLAAGNAVTLRKMALFKELAGVLTRVGSAQDVGTTIADTALSGATATIDVNGSVIEAKPTGVAAVTIEWICVAHIVAYQV